MHPKQQPEGEPRTLGADATRPPEAYIAPIAPCVGEWRVRSGRLKKPRSRLERHRQRSASWQGEGCRERRRTQAQQTRLRKGALPKLRRAPWESLAATLVL